MNRDGHNSVRFFIGPEVEHTPAYSKKTLFVVDLQDTLEIEKYAKEYKTPHIFLGANHSFDAVTMNEKTVSALRNQVTYLLDHGYMVTLDYPAHQHELVLPMFTAGVWQSRLFVPLLSVRIPKIQTSNPNLTVKIDDVDFKATNPGVWCMHFHEVTDSNRFTDWQEYETDIVIRDTVAAPVTPAPKQVVAPVAAQVSLPLDVATQPTQNEVEIGLDLAPTTALKADDTNVSALGVITDPVDAAAAYAEGAKVDPVAVEGKKSAKAKK